MARLDRAIQRFGLQNKPKTLDPAVKRRGDIHVLGPIDRLRELQEFWRCVNPVAQAEGGEGVRPGRPHPQKPQFLSDSRAAHPAGRISIYAQFGGIGRTGLKTGDFMLGCRP